MTETSALRWFDRVPVRRVRLIRSLVFGYGAAWLVLRGLYIADVHRLPARRFDPIGVLGMLSAPPSGWLVLFVWLVTVAASVSTALNRSVRVTAPIGAVGLLALATYTSSFGQVFHTEHLLVLHAAVLAVAVVVEPPAPEDGETSGWPLNLMMATVVVAYLVAGAAKLRYSGIEWVTGDVLRHAVAMDNLRKLLFDDWHSPIGGWLSSVAWIWAPIALATIAVEVLAPVALVPGRARQVWIALAWGFHVGIFVLMAISFPYQLLGVAYAAFLPVERITDRLGARWDSLLLLRRRVRGRTV